MQCIGKFDTLFPLLLYTFGISESVCIAPEGLKCKHLELIVQNIRVTYYKFVCTAIVCLCVTVTLIHVSSLLVTSNQTMLYSTATLLLTKLASLVCVAMNPGENCFCFSSLLYVEKNKFNRSQETVYLNY